MNSIENTIYSMSIDQMCEKLEDMEMCCQQVRLHLFLRFHCSLLLLFPELLLCTIESYILIGSYWICATLKKYPCFKNQHAWQIDGTRKIMHGPPLSPEGSKRKLRDLYELTVPSSKKSMEFKDPLMNAPQLTRPSPPDDPCGQLRKRNKQKRRLRVLVPNT